MKFIKKLSPKRSKNGKKSLQYYGLFLCPYCKKEVERNIQSGHRQKSCGCAQKELQSKANTKHGDSGSRLYLIWGSMKQRCYSTGSPAYSDYGGRGISVFSKWRVSYIDFKKWALKNGYNDTLQLDRIDNDGNYCPENCQFVTQAQNKRNTRATKLTMEIANNIRRDYATGKYTQKELTKKYDCCLYGNMNKIIRGKRWNPSS